MDDLLSERDRCHADMQRFVANAVRSFEGRLQEKLTALSARKDVLSREAKVLETFLHKIELNLRSKAKAELIIHSNELLATFSQVTQEPSVAGHTFGWNQEMHDWGIFY